MRILKTFMVFKTPNHQLRILLKFMTDLKQVQTCLILKIWMMILPLLHQEYKFQEKLKLFNATYALLCLVSSSMLKGISTKPILMRLTKILTSKILISSATGVIGGLNLTLFKVLKSILLQYTKVKSSIRKKCIWVIPIQQQPHFNL